MGSVSITVPVWSEPKLITADLLPVEQFNLKLLPIAVRDWVADTSYRMDNSPADYMAVAAMVVLGSLIGDKATIKPKKNDDWTVVPNLWGVVVGRPSAKKTPALKEACRVLDVFDQESTEIFIKELEVYAQDVEFHDIEKQEAKKDVKKIISNDRDEAKDIYMSACENQPTAPVWRRRVTNNTSIEKLGEIQRDNPHGIMVFRDELTGWLQSLDSKDHGPDRAYYLEGWSGLSSFINDTISRGTTYTPKHIVSVLGGIQPGKLKTYLLSRQSGHGDDGLLERFQLMVYPDNHKLERIDIAPNNSAQKRAYDVFRQMDDIEDGGNPYRFTPDAQAAFNNWYDENLEKCTGCKDVHIESLLGKYASLVASLALIIHLCEAGPGTPVSLNAVTMAAGWAEYLESHARRVNGLINNPAILAENLVVHLKDLNNPFTPREVLQKGWRGLTSSEDIKSALNCLCESGHIRREREEQTGGRPSVKYQINPRLL